MKVNIEYFSLVGFDEEVMRGMKNLLKMATEREATGLKVEGDEKGPKWKNADPRVGLDPKSEDRGCCSG